MIPDSHPGLPGHFPRHPIVPGVVTLDYVVNGLLKQIPGAKLVAFPQVKFFQPLLPEVVVTVTYKFLSDGRYQFCCESNEIKILSGQICLTKPDDLT